MKASTKELSENALRFRPGLNGLIGFQVSFGLDVGFLDDFAPLGMVALDLFDRLRRRQKFSVATQLLELLL